MSTHLTIRESVLSRGVRRTGTEFWNDSCGIDDLRHAILDGATGATSNPPIVLSVVRAERLVWQQRARDLSMVHESWAETEIAWHIYGEVVRRGAAELMPVFERTSGSKGCLSAQVNPRFAKDAHAMIEQALWLASLAPNIQVKLPVSRAGLVAIEEVTARGVDVNATANFTVSGTIAVAEAVERGIARRALSAHAVDPHPVCTVMVGRLDDWLKTVCARNGILLTPGTADWAGIAVFKRALEVYEARGYRTRLLAGAFRSHLPWSQLLGADTIVTIPPAWQRWINRSSLTPGSRVRTPVPRTILRELTSSIPEFRRAHEPEGMTADQFEEFGAYRSTLRQFLEAYQALESEVRDAILPDPESETQ